MSAATENMMNEKLERPVMKLKIRRSNNQDHPDEERRDLELYQQQKAAEKVKKVDVVKAEDEDEVDAAGADADDELEEGEIREDSVEDSDEDSEEGGEEEAQEEEENQELPAEDVNQELLKNIKDEELVVDGGKICPCCGKWFKNGKALGGHRRSCGDKKKAVKRAGPGFSPGTSPGPKDEGGEGGGKYKCEYCPKDFPTEKALFGHMRQHPERPFRGMNPPKLKYHQGDQASSSKVALGEGLGSPVGSLVNGWSSKGRRGHKGGPRLVRGSPGGSTISSKSSEEEVAAAELMLMYRSNKKPKLAENPNHVEVIRKGYGKLLGYDLDELYYLKHMGDLDFDDEYDSTDDDEFSDEEEVKEGSNSDDDCVEVEEEVEEEEEEVTVNESPEPPLVTLKKGGVKMKKEYKNANGKRVRDVDGDHDDEGGRFRCSTCGMKFDTHQALGGHRSSHNKDKNKKKKENNHGQNSHNVHARLTMVEGSRLNGDDGETSGKLDDHKSFASGQALGGHVRSDYRPDEQSSGDQSSGEATVRRGNIIDLDLNRSPQEEGDDDEVVQGFY